jgi:hypothetical protein
MKTGERVRVGVAAPLGVRFKTGTIVGERRTADGEVRFEVARDDGVRMPTVHPINVHAERLVPPRGKR